VQHHPGSNIAQHGSALLAVPLRQGRLRGAGRLQIARLVSAAPIFGTLPKTLACWMNYLVRRRKSASHH